VNMKADTNKPDVSVALSRLKDFQLRTVDYVFKRLYEDNAKRFLIADEVGLGKTLVARGVVGRAIDHLWPDLKRLRRIDVVYICSNGDIVRQNVNRLNVFSSDDENEENHNQGFANRLTLLPLYLKELDDRPLNFIALTPGTSFNKRSSGGIAWERELIYHMLREAWDFGGETAPMNIFQYGVQNWKVWRHRLKIFDTSLINPGIQRNFEKDLKKHRNLLPRFNKLKKRFRIIRKSNSYYPEEDRELQRNFIGDIRRILAGTCLEKIEPDIIILDEFQRFRYLLEGDSEASELAQALFDYPDAKILLLSATPFKPYTCYHESEEDNHYQDFLKTLSFLFGSDEETAACKKDLSRLGEALHRIGREGGDGLMDLKKSLENRLRKVMVRTERLSIANDRNGMIEDIHGVDEKMAPGDLLRFSVLDNVAQNLQVGDPLEYWKSAPYILNTMDHSGYMIKKQLLNALTEEGMHDRQLVDALGFGRDTLLPWKKIEAYRKVDPGNARMRTLMSESVDKGTWQLLWIPPSLPYYRVTTGPYAQPDVQNFSKTLVFSSWKIVPKVIAMLTSYEAERRMAGRSIDTSDPYAKNYSKEYRNKGGLLTFPLIEGRPERMNNIVLFYPCLTLATRIDPLQTATELIADETTPNFKQVNGVIKLQIKELIEPVIQKYQKKTDRDRRWYWAALALLDREYNHHPTQTWLEYNNDDLAWRQTISSEYVERFYSMFENPPALGEPPDDLFDVLTAISIASPAVATLRSFLRVVGQGSDGDSWVSILGSAAWAAIGFQTLFNLPGATAMLRSRPSLKGSRYWQTVLTYCAHGNLQSVLDEYTHILVEALGLMDKPCNFAVEALSDEINDAVGIQTVNLELDEIKANRRTRKISLTDHSMRCRFALRFGDGRGEASSGDQKTETRRKQVRQAFNSPFWPFVLASTSIGQEGLDFHQYCLNVFHWNLPGNPVDLEQREGREHRYKGHAIRFNIAQRYPLHTLVGKLNGSGDPWAILFEMAHNDAKKAGYPDELVPFWVFPDGQHKIRRHTPVYPFSKDAERIDILKNGLVTYRMVLGQPRQEDLVNFLQQRVDEGLDIKELLKYRVDLSPN
jgi:hypothetical protein